MKTILTVINLHSKKNNEICNYAHESNQILSIKSKNQFYTFRQFFLSIAITPKCIIFLTESYTLTHKISKCVLLIGNRMTHTKVFFGAVNRSLPR